MKYMLLIQYGDTPLPGSPEWEALSDEEQKAVAADYQAVSQTRGSPLASGWSTRRRRRPSGSRTARR
jgi:hypothetical protein